VRVILVAILLLISSCCVFAQSPNGSIRGIVFDPDAKSIAGAEVIVVNDATGMKYVTSTNADGLYAVENLPPGPYRIQVSKFGFKGIIKPDIILNVEDIATLNFTLPIGASSVTVTVEGGAPMINTTDATVSTVVDRQFAENLPMNGRSFQTLIELTPGVVLTTSTAYDSGQFSVNGQRAASNYWSVDGVSANIGVGTGQFTPGNGVGGTMGAFSALGGTNSLVSVDALEEFRVQTSTFAPEFGRTPGAQISILTRSGTNQFHGTAFDYVRNDMFDANNWFNGYTNPHLPKAEERQNDFGGTLSGPVLRDRAFFFFSYEGLRLRLPQTVLTTVPDLTGRQNAIPEMQPYLKAYPLPNGSDNGSNGTAAFDASYSNPGSLDAYSIRLDHKLNRTWSLFGRYNNSPSEFVARGSLSAGAAALSVLAPNRIDTQTVTAGGTWTVNSRITNDVRFNYSRVDAQGTYKMDDFGGAVPLQNPPFPTPYSSDSARFYLGITGLTNPYLFIGAGIENVQRQFNVVEGASLQKGRHSVKIGADLRRLSPSVTPDEYRLYAGFRNVASAETGQSSVGIVSARKDVRLLFHNLGLYAQDTWRINSSLTLTYGLRWDLDFAPTSVNGPSIPALTRYNLTDLSQLAIAPAGTAAFKTTYGNVAPRVGAAYQVSQNQNWQTVLRGGLGVFYDLVSSETGNTLSGAIPPFGDVAHFLRQPFPFTPAQSAPLNVPPAGTLAEFFAFNPKLRLPYTLEWNFAIEQALGQQQTMSATYVGASGRQLLQSTQIFSPPSNPNIALGNFVDNTATSDYNALQLQFQRRLSRGVQALASYTWSHSIDDASAGSLGSSSNINIPNAVRANRGASDFDIRNAFTAGLTFDVPGLKKEAILRALLGGWALESFVLVRSAPAVDLSDAQFFELDGGIATNVRPDAVAGQPAYLYSSAFPGGKALNPAAFSDPPADPATGNPLRQGTLGRNALRGFGASQWDFAVHRDFPIREVFRLQFRAEMFNVLNHPNFGPPQNVFGQNGFGLSTQTLGQSLAGGNLGGGSLDPLYQIGGPRSIQFALKLIF
jgi:hypothetical protein